MLIESCLTCGVELVCIQNDMRLVKFTNDNPLEGVDAFRYGDVYQCPVCKCKVMIGLGVQVEDGSVNNRFLEEINDEIKKGEAYVIKRYL